MITKRSHNSLFLAFDCLSPKPQTTFLIVVQILLGCIQANILLHVWFLVSFFFYKYSWEQKVMVFIFSESKYKATEPPAWISRFNYSEKILVTFTHLYFLFMQAEIFKAAYRSIIATLASLKISISIKYQASQRQEIPALK